MTAAALAPPASWFYTGGLENHPRIVEQVSKSRPLWGNPGGVLRRIRDPWHVAALLDATGLPACRVWPRGSPYPATDGNWMLKPLRGAAGRGIHIWDDCEYATLREPHYFQERRSGAPVSALFLALPRRTTLLGVARQLVGLKEVHAPPFAWCGAITPINMPVETNNIIERIGAVLAEQTRLRGLFGCDFLIGGGVPWLTEVNPRYPASTELFEHFSGVPLLDWHRQACEDFDNSEGMLELPTVDDMADPMPAGQASTQHRAGVVGKVILYAERDLIIPDAMRFVDGACHGQTLRLYDELPYMADIPAPGARIARGQPICTLFARAASESACLVKLVRRAARFEAQCTVQR